MRREIRFGIPDSYGYVSTSADFAPFIVFECIVKKQITRLKSPIRKCIDSVLEELISAVRSSTQDVSDLCNLKFLM